MVLFDRLSCIRSGNNDDNSLTGIFANDVNPLSARGRLVDSTWIHGNQSFETRDDIRIMAR